MLSNRDSLDGGLGSDNIGFKGVPMGEYWKLVNVTKGQHIHPHRVDCGLKWGEWADYDSVVILRARALVANGIWSAGDELRAVSDYGGNRRLIDLATLAYSPGEDGGDELYGGALGDVSVLPKLPGQVPLHDWSSPSSFKAEKQDVIDIIAVARRVQSDCADPQDIEAAARLLVRLGQ